LVASAQPEPSSLPGAAALGETACAWAEPRWAEPVGSDVREQPAEAARAVSDGWARPRGAAVAEPDVELGEVAALGAAQQPAEAAGLDAEPQPVVAAVPDAELQPAAVLGPELGAGLLPGAARDEEPRRAAGPSVAAPSAFHRGQALPWLAR